MNGTGTMPMDAMGVATKTRDVCPLRLATQLRPAPQSLARVVEAHLKKRHRQMETCQVKQILSKSNHEENEARNTSEKKQIAQ